MKIDIVNFYKHWKINDFRFILFAFTRYTNERPNWIQEVVDHGYKNVILITLLNVCIIVRWRK